VFELLVVLSLTVLNGIFSLSELAIVSARKARLKGMAEAGSSGARAALALQENPGRFLSTVQIGITLVGVLAGTSAGDSIGGNVTDFLLPLGVPEGLSKGAGTVIAVAFITYLSVVVGELVPKHLALGNTEGFACLMARPMTIVSKVSAPVVWLLDASTKVILTLMGKRSGPESAVTEEEVKTIMAEAETAGVLEADERKMISGVMRLGDQGVRGIMTPRTDVDWIDLSDTEEAIRKLLINTKQSRLPVTESDPDAMLGVVQARDLLAAALSGKPLNVRDHVIQVPVVPDTIEALDALTVLQQSDVPMALVHDEYGHFEGLVTPADVLDAIAGAFRSDEDASGSEAFQREDGSWLIAGSMRAFILEEKLGIKLPEDRTYDTVAGLVIDVLRSMPETGDRADAYGWRFEVVDMDGRRIDKVLVSRIGAAAEPAAA